MKPTDIFRIHPWNKFTIALHFEPRDLWVGLYWNRGEPLALGRLWDIYICIIPTLPLHIMFYEGEP